MAHSQLPRRFPGQKRFVFALLAAATAMLGGGLSACTSDAPGERVPAGADGLAVLGASIERQHHDERAEESCQQMSTGFGATTQPQMAVVSSFDSTYEIAQSLASASGFPEADLDDTSPGDYAALCVLRDPSAEFGHVGMAVFGEGLTNFIGQWDES